MARIRRTIHKTTPAQTRLLDDQFWPLVVAMGVLGGFLAGSVLAYLDLSDSRWYANAWTWLIAIPIVIAAALIVLARTGNRALRRTMQLSAILGITVHLLLFIAALETDVFDRMSLQLLTVQDRQPEKAEHKVPEYLAWQHDRRQRARQDTEQPTPVDLPEPELAAQTKEQTESVATDLEPQPRPILEPEVAERPNIVKRAETGEAVPRQSAEMSKLSRRDAPQPERAPQVVPVPAEQLAAQSATRVAESPTEASPLPSESLTPNPTQTAKQETRAPEAVERREAPPTEIAVEVHRDRRTPQQPAPNQEQLAAAPRPVPNRQPRVTARPDVTAVVDAEPNPETIANESPVATPANTALTQMASPAEQAATSSPRATQSLAEAGAVESSARRAPTVPIPDAQVAAANAALPTRSRSEAQATGAVAERVSPVAKEAVAVTPQAAEAGPAPTAIADVSKQGSGALTSERSRVAVEMVGDANTPQTAAQRAPTTLDTTNPALTPGAANMSPRRAVREADAPASPLAIENPARSEPSTTHADTLSAPTPMVLNRSETGVAGRGLGANLADAEPAPASPATMASGSAQRAAASQTLAEGPALTPQEAALVRSSRAGSHQPGTVLAAQPAPSAALPGSTQTADVDANASAALTQAASNAEHGSVTAAKGTQSADTGPTTLVAEAGAGRAAGGGQPDLNAGASPAAVPRAQPDHSAMPQSLAGSLAAQPLAPPGQGGGQPESSDMKLSSQGIVNARLASPSERLGGTPGAGGGPETIPTASTGAPERRGRDVADVAGPAGATDVARVTRQGARDSQLNVDWGAADLNVGNAADQTDRDEPGALTAAGAATTQTGKTANASGVASTSRAAVDVPAAPVGGMAGGLAARNEAAQGLRDEPQAGGGTNSPPRTGRGPELADHVNMEPVAVEGLPGLDQALAGAMDSHGEQTLDAGDAEVGPVSRMAGPVLPVDVQAPEESGGIGTLLARDVGLRSRQALDSSTDIQLESNRFSRDQRGGRLESTTSAAMPTDSFRGRMQRGQGQGDPADGTGPQTEEAVELGLVFLHSVQLPDGRWTLDRNADTDGMPQMASDTAATGLALLAFQGAGYHHLDHRYAQVVRNGIEFLVRNQQPDGSLFVPMDAESNRVVVFYSHSIAALALCEAYGMTQDVTLREPAQRAIDFIVKTQNQQRGGWRYTPGVSTDTSVTGWMMMALKSGELANLKVPRETYENITRWLDSAQASATQPHLYCYNPFATEVAEQRGGRQPTRTMTSVGLLMRLYLGWRRDNPNMARGAKYLAQAPPAVGTATSPQRDTYYWYYATQVMFHMGGQYWRDWNRHLHPVLVKAQVRSGPLAGSWDPARPVADRWGPHAGRLYVTTMNLLSLEVAYRHLPLYEDTAK